MIKRVILVVAIAGCGDNLKPPGSGGDDSGTDTPPAATFTAFVIDQITHHAMDTGQPVPFDQFSTLPDPDLNNPDPKVGGYSSLFP